MNDTMMTVTGVLIPLVGTSLGAGMAFFIKSCVKPALEKFLLGFASGVMIAASIWSLLIPAIDMAAEAGITPWVPAVTGFFLGILFLLALDRLMPYLHMSCTAQGGRGIKLGKSSMLVFAVTLHNIPEGMAVGVAFAGALSGEHPVTMAGALALAVGIGIQNFPEGAVISMPLVSDGMKRPRAFACGVLSGVVEPVAAGVTILLTSLIAPLLPYMLAFAAGAMIYVVVEELIPDAQKGGRCKSCVLGTSLGFAIMMTLDVALS